MSPALPLRLAFCFPQHFRCPRIHRQPPFSSCPHHSDGLSRRPVQDFLDVVNSPDVATAFKPLVLKPPQCRKLLTSHTPSSPFNATGLLNAASSHPQALTRKLSPQCNTASDFLKLGRTTTLPSCFLKFGRSTTLPSCGPVHVVYSAISGTKVGTSTTQWTFDTSSIGVILWRREPYNGQYSPPLPPTPAELEQLLQLGKDAKITSRRVDLSNVRWHEVPLVDQNRYFTLIITCIKYKRPLVFLREMKMDKSDDNPHFLTPSCQMYTQFLGRSATFHYRIRGRNSASQSLDPLRKVAQADLLLAQCFQFYLTRGRWPSLAGANWYSRTWCNPLLNGWYSLGWSNLTYEAVYA
ncbi:hypothetical protein C8F04DRAFT_1257586 [Mycena alexandri]|uniref:Uncharacterized protein n=1 Tax=Mycena alexandri TaxID=1745969 RepID=A0AAD6T1C3_9AGAR|nr:hypothetical protein C8F04DRAFT_1257586 [Mycena alexandri]